jgi:WD40 repeat protein
LGGSLPTQSYAPFEKGPVQDIAVAPSGLTLAVAWTSGVNLYRLNTFERLWGRALGSKIRRLSFSSDGNTLAVGTETNIIVLDTTTGTPVTTFKRSIDYVNSLAFSPDGKMIALGAQAGILLVNAKTGDLVRLIDGKVNGVCVTFSPDGKLLASGSRESSTIIWDVASGKPIHSFAGYSSSLSFSPNGKILATLLDGGIALVDLGSNQRLLFVKSSDILLSRIAFSPDGKRFASTSEDGTIILRDVKTGKILNQFSNSSTKITHVFFTPDGKKIIVNTDVLPGTGEGNVILWDIVTGKKLLSLGPFTG